MDRDEHLPFWLKIVSDLEDRTPRLVYADWLEERGELEVAGLMRAHRPPLIEFLPEGSVRFIIAIGPASAEDAVTRAVVRFFDERGEIEVRYSPHHRVSRLDFNTEEFIYRVDRHRRRLAALPRDGSRMTR